LGDRMVEKVKEIRLQISKMVIDEVSKEIGCIGDISSEIGKKIFEFECSLGDVDISDDRYVVELVSGLEKDIDEYVSKFIKGNEKELGKEILESYLQWFNRIEKRVKPPKEWFTRVVRRLMEQGYGEESARRLAGWIYYHHLKPYKPKSKKEPDKPSTAEARRRKRLYEQTKKSASYEERLRSKLDKLEDKVKQFDDWLTNLNVELEDLYMRAKEEGDDSASLIRKVCEKLESARVQMKEKFSEIVRMVK